MFMVKKKVPTRMATTPRAMAILAIFAAVGRRTDTAPSTMAATPRTQPAIEIGLASSATTPTISAILPRPALSCFAVFLRASVSRRSATVFSELMQVLRVRVPRDAARRMSTRSDDVVTPTSSTSRPGSWCSARPVIDRGPRPGDCPR